MAGNISIWCLSAVTLSGLKKLAHNFQVVSKRTLYILCACLELSAQDIQSTPVPLDALRL